MKVEILIRLDYEITSISKELDQISLDELQDVINENLTRIAVDYPLEDARDCAADQMEDKYDGDIDTLIDEQRLNAVELREMHSLNELTALCTDHVITATARYMK